MTDRRERELLSYHGTQLMRLKPSSILAAAESDLRLRCVKAFSPEIRTQPYAFHRLHVQRAKDAADLVRLALNNRERGIASGKINTRLIYGDTEVLREAAQMVGVAKKKKNNARSKKQSRS